MRSLTQPGSRLAGVSSTQILSGRPNTHIPTQAFNYVDERTWLSVPRLYGSELTKPLACIM